MSQSMQSLKTERLSGEELSAFQVIVDFVNNLHNHLEEQKERIQSIQLYHRLIYQKSFQEVDLIRKHVNVFRGFCQSNRDAIREQSVTAITFPRIEFTDRIYIDIPYVFGRVDNDTKRVIWEYLLAISAHLDPQNNTRAVLEQLQQQGAPPADALSASISALSSDPNQMMGGLMGGLMGNPAITGIMTKLMSNEIDLHKLITSITPIVENVKKEIEQSDDPTIKNMIAMIQSIEPSLEPELTPKTEERQENGNIGST